MQNIMGEIIKGLIIGMIGIIVSIFNIMEKFPDLLIGAVVGLFTIIFLIFQIVKLNKDIQIKNMEICEKRKKLKE